MKHWEDNTCLKFEQAGTLQMSNYIMIRGDRSGCFSMIGRVPGLMRPQILNLGRGCVSRGTVVHEIGHAIGFFHEQSRSDRDQHIRILWHNINSNMRSQFAKASDNTYGVPYDYSSVMQYREWAFQADPEKNTIVTVDPLMQLLLGNTELSFRDKQTANAMYHCDANCPNVNEVKCENGGYMFQRYGSTSKCSCICPPNTAGELCEILLDRGYYEPLKCGGNITTEGPIQTPNAPYTTFPDGGCVFWIQAPEGKVARVDFSDFSFQSRRLSPRNPLAGRKCPRERVEIRTSSLFEGKVYCSNDLAKKSVTSTKRDMVIIASAKHSGYPGGFRAMVSFVNESLVAPSKEITGPIGILNSIFG
ncbi:blastula protease 10-like [Tropilaelaps mercedesae]|uniref:Metalloendopeptidase n=1 Tax=Tropilaelaps mercedesae TaxID=418985 RepID=A0A1V9XDD6_9ACAR|nr:blastula protease 10-like [Tropilaelaps mercedesae]